MKTREMRELSDGELKDKLDGFKQELFNLRWQTASHQNQNPKRIRDVKRIIARALTILNERDRKEAAK
ncbi:MAG TPA: 50S ribosomal protein L29 [bacterium]|nr:MAG: 50S ribosomal protein L29 [bacterium ADurb.Bin236]HOC92629.1 50S ribosomal protein L29 [bacterium]HOY62216.1 50S ribosomal protein L29 [bacterium]HPI75440.1 50S ribosomal protein L29 [bacterium]HPN93431.1 50S ribosomal protein L29 [bacterium]